MHIAYNLSPINLEIITVKQTIRRRFLLVLLMLGMVSQAAMGVVITQAPHLNTDVGGVDLFVTEAGLQGNPTNETIWVNTVLGTTDASFTIKTEAVDYFATDMANVFAFQLQSTAPSYFVIKNAQRVALYRNVAGLDWAVFDASLLSSAINLPSDDFEISHVTELSGGSASSVPEPSTLALLGLGLIGIFFVRRREVNQPS